MIAIAVTAVRFRRIPPPRLVPQRLPQLQLQPQQRQLLPPLNLRQRPAHLAAAAQGEGASADAVAVMDAVTVAVVDAVMAAGMGATTVAEDLLMKSYQGLQRSLLTC